MTSNDSNSTMPKRDPRVADEKRLTPRAELDTNDLLFIVSRDLMAPLTEITSSATRLRNLAAVGAPHSSMHDCAEDILRSTAAMQQLLDDLQVGSAAATSPRSPGPPQDIERLINQVMEIFLPLAATASIDLRSDIRGPIMVRCDAPRLFEALAHLIDVAIKFGAAGANVRVSASCDRGECLISVVDNEAGIGTFEEPPALSIARMIIEAHHGRLWIDSHLGAGSACYITLPLA